MDDDDEQKEKRRKLGRGPQKCSLDDAQSQRA